VPEHRERLRVRWADTDASGRIHFTAAFRYFEIAEFELLRSLGVSHGSMEVDFPRVDVGATFRKPLTFDDVVEVRIRPGRVGERSVTYECRIYRGEELAIEGHITAVAVGRDGKSCPLPAAFRRALES
jgi:YbgC/YbaW family acyl-CoA thioester hydrolase